MRASDKSLKLHRTKTDFDLDEESKWKSDFNIQHSSAVWVSKVQAIADESKEAFREQRAPYLSR